MLICRIEREADRSSQQVMGIKAQPPASAQVLKLARTPAVGYTDGMKTAVSLPNEVFRSAERFAKRARKTRSRLYAEALTEYLARHAPDEVTEDMNGVVDQLVEPVPDAFVAAAARRLVKDVEW